MSTGGSSIAAHKYMASKCASF